MQPTQQRKSPESLLDDSARWHLLTSQYIIPEAALQAFTSLLLLLSGDWVSFLINTPVIAWNARKFTRKAHVLDATEIFRTVQQHKNETYSKLAFHLILFFYYLYCLIMAIVMDETS